MEPIAAKGLDYRVRELVEADKNLLSQEDKQKILKDLNL
jgi:hypothetical protein